MRALPLVSVGSLTALTLSSSIVACDAADGEPLDGTQNTNSNIPTVVWREPSSNGDVVSGMLDEPSGNCLVDVVAPAGVEKVEFFLDGSTTPLNSEAKAPYACRWDTRTATEGPHTLTAVVTDTAGASGSATLTVEVRNRDVGPEDDAGSGTRPPGAKDYWVSATGDDRNPGTKDRPFKAIKKINSLQLRGGDIVHLTGTLTDDLIRNQSGKPGAPVVFKAEGRATIKGIHLTKAEHVEFVGLEAKGRGISCSDETILVRTTGKDVVRHIVFDGLYLHDTWRAVSIGGNDAGNGAKHTDITFKNTRIERTTMEGIVLEDYAGDRFRYIGGSIQQTGLQKCRWTPHGIYASGGHHHVFDGVTFGANKVGWSISMRRGDTTVRNCTFNGGKMLGNVNEDEAKDGGRRFLVHDNVFNATPDGRVAIYQGGHIDKGVERPNHTWFIYRNTFNGVHVNFNDRPGDGIEGDAAYYNVFMCNNVFNAGTTVSLGITAPGYVHEQYSTRCPQ